MGLWSRLPLFSIIEVDEIVEPGEIDSYRIDTPGLYVDRIVKVES